MMFVFQVSKLLVSVVRYFALQNYYKNLEYTRILAIKCKSIYILWTKGLLFAQRSERKFGGNPPKGKGRAEVTTIFFYKKRASEEAFSFNVTR